MTSSKAKSSLYADMVASFGKLQESSDVAKLSKNTPASALAQALRRVQVPDALYKGMVVTKVTSSTIMGNAFQKRILTLSKDHLALFVTHQQIQGGVATVANTLPIPFWTPSKGFGWSNSKSSLQERYVRYLDIADIDAVVVGVVNSTTLEKQASNSKKIEAERIVTLYHHGMEDSLNVLIASQEQRDEFVSALQQLRQVYHKATPWISNKALLLRYLWYHVDVDQSGLISKSEFKRICDIINLQVDAAKYFDDFVKITKRQELEYHQCMQLLHSIQDKLLQGSDWTTAGPLWKDLFEESSDNVGSGSITPTKLHRNFLVETQKESVTILDAQNLVQVIGCLDLDSDLTTTSSSLSTKHLKISSSSSLPAPNDTVVISKEQWQEYILSKFNSAYDPAVTAEPAQSYFDFPISHYWINTSHNTYLLGDQLQSKSSVQAYQLSLERGCKCLELDCWDGPSSSFDKEQAVVYHGHTLTSKILFRDIIKVVKAYMAANPTTLPIILSLENHCSPAFQKSIARQLSEILGDCLYVPPPIQKKKESYTVRPLPSPNALRGKVVIKGKRPPELDEDAAAAPSSTTTPPLEDDDSEDPYDEAMAADPAAGKGDPGMAKKTAATPAVKSKIVPELAKLTLFHGTKFKKWDTSIASDPSHMHSIGETKISKLLSKSSSSEPTAKLWREYNQHHMTRTYPSGVRVDSSNYNPILAWAMGCQLVALNFQTPDVPLLLNDGRFLQAGGGGYVLKPPSTMGTTTTNPKPRTIHIQIISGHCLPKPKGVKVGEAIDPYVRVELHDVRSNDKEWTNGDEGELRTSIVSNNGFCPSWPSSSSSSKNRKTWCVFAPEVAMLMFQILDDDLGVDDNIASAAIPINALRAGYRSVQLFSGHKTDRRSGPFEYASLLVKIAFDDHDVAGD